MAYIGGLYTGIEYVAGSVDDASAVTMLDNYLQTLVNLREENSVVSIFLMPTAFYTTGVLPVQKTLGMIKPTKINGHEPRNKKLLTYPYVFINVDTLNSSKSYRYEWFKSDDNLAHFNLLCGMSPNPEIVCYPVKYNGANDTATTPLLNPTESVTCTGFPQVAFTIDTFSSWLANKSLGQGLSALASYGVASAKMASGDFVGGVLGYIGMASQLSNMVLEATEGSKVRGNQGGSTDVASRYKGIYFKYMSITKQYAEMIDDYFDRYGYATCRVKVPNRDVRPHWTYTKTKDISIRGNLPVESMSKLKKIYDNGITFWKNGSEVGNYSLNNTV